MFIYLIRDPREVIISYASYIDKSIDDLIESFTSDKSMMWEEWESIINLRQTNRNVNALIKSFRGWVKLHRLWKKKGRALGQVFSP